MKPIEITVTQTGTQATAAALDTLGKTAETVMKGVEQAAVATTTAATTAAQAVGKVFDQAAAAAQAAEYRLKALARQQAQTSALSGQQAGMVMKPLPVGAPLPGMEAVIAAPPKLAEVTGQIARQGSAAVEAGRGMRQMFDAVFSLAGLQSPLAGRLQQTAIALESMTAGAGVAVQTLGPLGVGLGLAAAAAAALVAGLFQVAKSTAAYADAQGKQAEKIGVTVEEFTRLNYVAKLNNVSSEQLTTGLVQIGAQAVKNSEAFQLLGISTRKANGEQKNSAELFVDVAEKFAGYEEGITKTRLAQQLFALGLGKELLPILNQGRDGIAKLSEEVEKYGGVTSEAEAKAAGRFNDSMTRLVTIAESLWHMLGNSLIPTFADLLEDILRMVGGITSLRTAFALFAVHAKSVGDALLIVADSAKMALAASWAFASASAQLAVGNFAGARKALVGLADDYAKVGQAAAAAVGIRPVTLGPTAPKPIKTVAPALETEEEKQERKRQAAIYQIREKGAADLAALVAKGDREAVDAAYKADEISAEKYYAARADLIGRDLDLQLLNLRIRAAAEDDAEKKSTELTAGENLALEQQRVARAALAIEQAADLRRTQDKLDREQKTADALQRRYDVHRQEMPLHELEAQMSAVESDRTLTTAERRGQIGNLLQKELDLMPALIAAAQAEADSRDLGERIKGQEKLLQLQTRILQIKTQQNNLPPDTFFQRFNTGLDALSEKWGNFGANLADDLTGSLSSTMDGFGDKVLDVASGVKSIGELGIASLRQLTSSLITTVAQWVVQMTLVRALQKVFNIEQKTDAAARATAEAPAAALASVGSFGTAAVVGGLALAAVLAMALAFESGGRVKGGEQLIRVNEKGEETVINAAGTQRWAGLLEKINAGAATAADLHPHLPAPNYEALAGSQAATAAATGRASAQAMAPIQVPEPRVEIHYAHTEREVRRILESKPGRNVVIRHVNESRGSQGFEPL